MKILRLIFFSALFIGLNARASRVSVSSPDAQTVVELESSSEGLSYTVHYQNKLVLGRSSLGLIDGKKMELVASNKGANSEVWEPIWGQFGQITNRYQSLKMALKVDGGDVVLECRVFNDGVGLRFISGEKPLKSVDSIRFKSEYRWAKRSQLYWSNGESDPVGPISISKFKQGSYKPKVPVVVDSADGVFAAVLQSDLFSAKGFSAIRFGKSGGVLTGASSAKVAGQSAWKTPWRVVLLGECPGDLLMSTVPLNLAAECQLVDTSWIRPGKAMWDFRVLGYKADGFTYGRDTKSYLRFIDFAAKNGIQYVLLDASWFAGVKRNRFVTRASLDLPAVMEHAEKSKVEVMLYYDRKHDTLDDELLFPELASRGAVGMKYGFMSNNAGFTRKAIALAAESKLLINFHDSPCPMTGVERTMPNAVTREYCHAQQDARKAFSPTAFLKMAMINALTGPLDQANGNFGLNGINGGERERGPRLQQSYSSTVVSEAARVLVIANGLICLPDAPEEYEKKADLFEFIREMPATWDESLVINSAIGKHITTARRSKEEWFVASVINEAGGSLPISLEFLEPGIIYDATFYEDAVDTHCDTNREAYQVRKGRVTNETIIHAKLAPGGGHGMWIRPAK